MLRSGNRKRGLDVEREIIRLLSDELNLIRFPAPNYQLGSSRALSKATDDEGVDIVFTRNAPSVLRDLNIQIKRNTLITKGVKIDLEPLLRIGDMSKPVLINKLYQKQGKANKHVGTFVTINIHDYVELLKQATGVTAVPEQLSSQPNITQTKTRTKRR